MINLDKKVAEIANSYHDRDVMAIATVIRIADDGNDIHHTCDCCGKNTNSVISIEHDSCDFDKDLGVCGDCYLKIHTYWNENSPKKISPF